MNDNTKTARIAVIGGDARQIYLARTLADDGYTVRTYGIDNTDGVYADIPGVTKCDAVADATACCRAVIFPVKPKESINDHIDKIDSEPGTVIFAWNPDAQTVDSIAARGWVLFDLASDEALTVKNAQLTAEGSLSLFMNEKSTAVLGSRILVLGSGRVAKCVCRTFSALGADVTMMARSAGELAWAELSRWGIVDVLDETARLRALSSGYDAIINTIPTPLLSGCALDAIPGGTLVIDLASAPYGIDPDRARLHGITAYRASALPGKYAPAAAASLIAECVRRHLRGGVR